MLYLNTITAQGKETVDQIDRKDFETFKEYKKEVSSLLFNYTMSGMRVYTSQKKCKNW